MRQDMRRYVCLCSATHILYYAPGSAPLCLLMVRAESYKNNLRQNLRPYVNRDVCHPSDGYAPSSAPLCLLYICGYGTLNNATPFFCVYRGLGLRPYIYIYICMYTYRYVLFMCLPIVFYVYAYMYMCIRACVQARPSLKRPLT